MTNHSYPHYRPAQPDWNKPFADVATLRDWFAAMAPEPDDKTVQAAQSYDRARNPHNDGPPKPPLRDEKQIRAELRYQYADAMLAARGDK
jgi:hypothetical protein